MADAKKGAAKKKGVARKIDLASFGGLLVALGGILGGMVLEGGNPMRLVQLTGGMIVFGGTLGAVMVTTPMRVLRNTLSKIGAVFFEEVVDPNRAIEDIINYATKARKAGIVALESEADSIADPFLKKALMLAIDGADLKEIRNMMELELENEDHYNDEISKVMNAAGGFAPTIGIIGAVLGLMQVMKNLEDLEKVGEGIATAFVATVYGVASANLFFLPAGAKIKARAQASRQMKELLLEGVVGIIEGLNPKLIRVKLEAYTNHWSAAKPKAAKGKGAKEGAPAPAPAP